MAARSAEHAHFLKIPLPEFLFFAASFLPAATRPFCLCWPLRRLPPGYFETFFFFFFFFFFLAFGFFAAFFAGFFFAAVKLVRASVSFRIIRFTTVDSAATRGSSVNTMLCRSALSLVPLSQ